VTVAVEKIRSVEVPAKIVHGRGSVGRLGELAGELGIMTQLGFAEDEIPMLARIAFDDPQTLGNPREVDVAGYEEIYRNAFARGPR
jgi:choline dehydrogenase